MNDEYGLAIIYGVILFIIIRIFGAIWLGNMFQTRRPRRDHLFVKPSPKNIKIEPNSHHAQIFHEYMRAGCTVALDASYIMSYYKDIFAHLEMINPDSTSKIIISKETIKRIMALTDTKYSLLSKHVIQLIEHSSLTSKYIKIVEMDQRQQEAMCVNPAEEDEKELAAYSLYNKYNLTNVVLFSVNEETKQIGKKFGLDIYPIHKMA